MEFYFINNGPICDFTFSTFFILNQNLLILAILTFSFSLMIFQKSAIINQILLLGATWIQFYANGLLVMMQMQASTFFIINNIFLYLIIILQIMSFFAIIFEIYNKIEKEMK